MIVRMLTTLYLDNAAHAEVLQSYKKLSGDQTLKCIYSQFFKRQPGIIQIYPVTKKEMVLLFKAYSITLTQQLHKGGQVGSVPTHLNKTANIP